MVLASPGPLLTPPPSSPPPEDPYPVLLRPNSTPNGNHRPRPRQVAAAAAGGDGARETTTGPRLTRTCCDTPATARLCRGRPLTILQPTKRQPDTDVCMFITAVSIIKLFAWGEEESGGHVPRKMTSRGLCGLVCPSITSEGGGEGDCVKEGGGGEGERERERALLVR
jgi:hypothetical protein